MDKNEVIINGISYPATLWHYTDIDGFKQIMTPGAWLYGTHYRFFSDPQEGVYSEELPHTSPFVICFTTRGDEKKLWNKWKNKTFCIGFSYKALFEAAQYIFLSEVLKNEKDKVLLKFNDIRLYEVFYSDSPQDAYNEFIAKKAKDTNIQKSILRKNYFLRYKRKSFSNEREWRIVRNYDHIPQNQVEWIADKPRLPLFPINHACMITNIIHKAKDNKNAAIYNDFVNKSCERLGIRPVINQTRYCVITGEGSAK